MVFQSWLLGVRSEWGRRTDSSRLDHVADGETLDGLVLGSAAGAVAASDGLDVAAALLVATVVLSLLNHGDGVLLFQLMLDKWCELKRVLGFGRGGGLGAGFVHTKRWWLVVVEKRKVEW